MRDLNWSLHRKYKDILTIKLYSCIAQRKLCIIQFPPFMLPQMDDFDFDNIRNLTDIFLFDKNDKFYKMLPNINIY